ncbi:MAG: DegT/DnrJ/EryC1/StrS family aminotransferase [Burkholderiaceae bacterium]
MDVPIRYSDTGWARYLSLRLRPSADAPDRLRRIAAGRLGAERVFLLNSGRAALMTALAVMRESDAGRGVVVVPAYVCPSVVAAVERSGLEPRFAPIGRDLNPTPGALARCLGADVLAIVAVHTYGFPADVASIERMVEGRNVRVIDDAAHCMPGDPAPEAPGTGGSAGLYSFAMSKAVSNGYSGRGGMLVVNDESLLQGVADRYRGLQACAASVWDDLNFVTTCLWEPLFRRLPWRLQARIQEGFSRRAIDPWSAQKMSEADASLALEQIQVRGVARSERAARIRDILAAVPDGPGYWFPHRERPERLTRLALCVRSKLSIGEIRRIGAAAGMAIRTGYEMRHDEPLPFGTLFEIPLGAAWSPARLRTLAGTLGSIRME